MATPILNQPLEFLGSSAIGAPVASTAAIGVLDTKQYMPGNQVGEVGGAVAYESPNGLVTGPVALTPTIRPEDMLTIGVITKDSPGTEKVSLFDAAGLNAQLGVCSCATPGTTNYDVYANNESCNVYNALLSSICGKERYFAAVRISVAPRGGTSPYGANGNINARPDFTINIKRSNFQGNTETFSLNLASHRDPKNFDATIVDVPLNGPYQLIDMHTVWEFSAPAGVEVIFTFFQSLKRK